MREKTGYPTTVLGIFRHSLAARIIAGFALTALLALGLALVSLAYVDSVNRASARSADQNAEVSRAILELRVAVNQQSDAVRGILLDTTGTIDTADYTDARSRFAQAMEILQSQTVEQPELDALATIRTRDSAFTRLGEEEISLRQRGFPSSSLAVWQTTGRETRDSLLSAITDYQTLHDRRIRGQLARTQRESRWVLAVAIQLVVAAAAGAVLLGVLFTQQVTRRIAALVAAARRIAVGDFDARVPDTGPDELGELASVMNTMAARLNAGRAALERSRDQIARLNEVAAAVDSSLRLDEVVTIILDQLARMVSYERAAVFIEDNGKLRRFAGRHWEANEDRFVTDTDPEERDSSDHPLWASTPLAARGKAFGVLAAIAPESRPFSARDRQTVSLFGRQVAAAVQNARLYEQTDLDLRRQQKLREVVQRLSSQLNLAALLEELIGDAVELLDASSGSISLLEDDELVVRAVHNEDMNRIGTVMRPGEGAMGLALATREPVVAANYADLPKPQLIDPRVRGCIAVPIWEQDEIIGAFAVFAHDPNRHFGDPDVATLTLFAGHAAVAIQNARLYERSVALGVAEERNRMAREIHDTLAQGLTAITLQLDTAEFMLEKSRGEAGKAARTHVQRAAQLARQNMEEARRSVLDLRAAPLEGAGLATAIERYARQAANERGVPITVRSYDVATRYPARLEAGMFRITQEAIANALRHGKPTAVRVELSGQGGALTLTVDDDGQGFDPDAPRAASTRGGFGITGMRERTALLGGTLAIESIAGQGTRLIVTIPYAERPLSAAEKRSLA